VVQMNPILPKERIEQWPSPRNGNPVHVPT
jgi:hypothetical protein